ncbi:MAG: prepilin-type N-terminal cleavage/methylation domain-containing protein [Candidatus Shapirobacteria bacterium]|jgi:general secretion pathway protein G
MKNKIKNKKGFTLIELIVSVTIIAVLTVVGVVSYTGTSKKARDGRRVADLEKVRIALELYRQDLGSTYPADGTLTTKLAPKYIQAIPTDPKSGTYTYDQTGTGYTYELGAKMENLGSTNVAAYSGCGGTCNYKVVSP